VPGIRRRDGGDRARREARLRLSGSRAPRRLETTAAITASAAAFLVLGRFRRSGFLDELILAAGLSLLALSNLMFAALPAALSLHSSSASVWSMLFTGALAALLICVAALLPRRVATGPSWPLAIYGGTLGLAFAWTVLLVAFEDHLPAPVTSTSVGASQPHISAHPTVLSLQLLLLTLLYLLAALGFARRHRLTGDELSIWLEVACIFSAAARVNYAFHPSLYSDWV
jgi:hypothetical protein